MDLPLNFGTSTLQKAFDNGIIFPAGSNENELNLWPQDSSGSAPVWFGFLGLEELTVKKEVEQIMGHACLSQTETKPPKKQTNTHVVIIEGLPDVTEEISSKKCNSILARISNEEYKDGIIFAKTNKVKSPGKQLALSLHVELVPNFILFKDGEQYGLSLGIPTLPSKKLDLVIEYLHTGKEWDSDVVKKDEENSSKRMKLQ
eukprot:14391733-Ditylum_brightwellii.AAC.2